MTNPTPLTPDERGFLYARGAMRKGASPHGHIERFINDGPGLAPGAGLIVSNLLKEKRFRDYAIKVLSEPVPEKIPYEEWVEGLIARKEATAQAPQPWYSWNSQARQERLRALRLGVWQLRLWLGRRCRGRPAYFVYRHATSIRHRGASSGEQQ